MVLRIAGAFAQRAAVAGCIQNVVHNLERQPDAGRIEIRLQHNIPRGAGSQAAHHRRSPDQRAGFHRMHFLQQLRRHRLAAVSDIDHLPADHPLHAGSPRQLADAAQHCIRRNRPVKIGRIHRRKGMGQQSVAGQQGRSLIKLNVAGGLAAAQGVVIHAGQVVVDQRIGVNHLHRTGNGQR